MNNSTRYKVLFLSSWYPTRIHEFNGDFVKRHAKAVNIYSDVTCLHVIYDSSLVKKYNLVEKTDGDLIEIIIYFKSKPEFTLFRKLYKLYYYFKGFRYIKKINGKPDIIHANILIPIGFIAFLLSRIYKIPFVITEHWTGFLNGNYQQKNWFYRMFHNFIARQASSLIPVTENLSTSIKSFGIRNNFKIVPNVVNTNIFIVKNNSDNRIKQILHVSDLNDQHKNISGLLRAVKSLSENRQDFILQIIHNQENKDILNYAEKLKINKQFVTFLGKKSSHEVAELMSDSDFLVLFSNYENLPCVIVEALASGIPVLSTDVGGISEYINSQNGILINKGDENELVKQMNYMLDHYTEYNKENLHKFAVDHFSPKKIGLQFLEIYEGVIHD